MGPSSAFSLPSQPHPAFPLKLVLCCHPLLPVPLLPPPATALPALLPPLMQQRLLLLIEG